MKNINEKKVRKKVRVALIGYYDWTIGDLICFDFTFDL